MRVWEENIRKVIPYIPGEQPKQKDIIKPNANENPYPPAPGVRKALLRFSEMDYDWLRKYPDPTSDVLVESLANYYHLEKDQVFAGVGSDDVLAMAFLTFFNSQKPILFPDITYSFYDVWADLFHIPYERQPLDERFQIVPSDYYKKNGGVIFPNPNAPTGVLMPLDQIEDIIQHNQDVIVIIDEAYIDFGGVSALPLIEKYDNVLIVQTFSKSRSMAGMRVGYAMGNKTLIKYLNDVKYSFNSYTMNQTVLAAAPAAIEDEAYFQGTRKKIMETRERVKTELRELGFSFEDSMANFLFVTHEHYWARDILEALKRSHIYVRYFNQPRIDNHLRISIGTDEEMDQLITFLKTYLK